MHAITKKHMLHAAALEPCTSIEVSFSSEKLINNIGKICNTKSPPHDDIRTVDKILHINT